MAEIDAGRQVHSFRSLTAPDLAALGNPLICVNTVAWDHGTSTSAAPYVQVGNAKYVRAIAGGIQAVVLTRQNLALVNNTAYSADASGISLLSSYLSTLSANDLVIVAGPQSTAMQVNSAVAKIGASMLLDEGGSPATSPGNYSVIGIPGLPYGQAWQSSHVLSGVTPSLPNCQGTSDGDRGSNLSGYFTLDSTGVNYTFLFADFIPFDTRVPGEPPLTNAMRFGDRTITTGPLEVFGATSIGGFHVVIIDRRTAEPWDPTFYMATTQRNLIQGTIEPDAAGIGAVEDTIHGVLTVPDSPQTGDGPNQSLYFFTSIGSPAVADTKLFSSVMAANLTAFGVNPHTFMSLTANDTWSLASYDVSDPSLPRPRAFESSSLITPDNPSGRLVGFLAKNRRNAWIPSVADQTGQLNYSLFPLALQPASPWPFANTPGYQSANAWIAGQLRLPTPSDVRLNYPNTNLDFGGTLFTELNLLAWPGSACGCSEDEFDELEAGLRQEFEWIDGVRTLFRNLKSPLDTSEVPEAVDIAAIASQIEQSISPPNTTAEAEVWLVLSGIATVTSFATGIPGLGLGVSAYKLAVDLANGLSGNSLDTVRTGAQQLGAQLAANVNTALATFNQLQDIVVSDYGRLSQVGGNALTNPDWAWDGSTLNAAAELLTQSTNQVFWGSLMPLEYHVYKLLPGQNNNNQNITSASQYQCEGHDPETGIGQNVHTFQNAAASGQALFTADYVNDAAQRFVWVSVPPGQHPGPRERSNREPHRSAVEERRRRRCGPLCAVLLLELGPAEQPSVSTRQVRLTRGRAAQRGGGPSESCARGTSTGAS